MHDIIYKNKRIFTTNKRKIKKHLLFRHGILFFFDISFLLQLKNDSKSWPFKTNTETYP